MSSRSQKRNARRTQARIDRRGREPPEGCGRTASGPPYHNKVTAVSISEEGFVVIAIPSDNDWIMVNARQPGEPHITQTSLFSSRKFASK
jgi:hypothetical protein